MKSVKNIGKMQLAVIAASVILFGTWLGMNFRILTGEQSGFVRFFLTLLLSLAILLRPKPVHGQHPKRAHVPHLHLGFAIVGTALALSGIIFNVHQVEWLGILWILFTCLSWALPPTCTIDAGLALFVLYWSHPLPASVFGPLQLTMQRLSVSMSEWLLQLSNVRVWADGFVLYTGLNTFEVPEWCSGMRTATTVFLLALGLGILQRFKWHETAVLVALSIAQALVLNVLRIATMVALAPTTGSWAGMNFLHNTAGLIVLAAVFITYIEISIWKKRRNRAPAPYHETDLRGAQNIVAYPPFWSWVLDHLAPIIAIVLLTTLGPVLIFKSRPSHKIEMIKDVACTLRDTGSLETAQRAAEAVQRMVPDDDDWNMTVIRLLIIRQKHEAALAALNTMMNNSPAYDIEKDILRAYSLMALHRMSDAAILVSKMPEDIRQSDPRVGMILAEMAFQSRKADDVAKYAVIASRWHPNITRIRALYPFLRAYHKWREIADSDLGVPYTDSVQCLSAIEAHMNLNNTPAVAVMTQAALQAWPDDPRILEPLFFMALKRSEGQWEERFTAHFIKCIQGMQDPDTMNDYFAKCFHLGRPDLAWHLYNRIAAIDPTNPALFKCAAKHGDNWFNFRKRFLGISAPSNDDLTSIKPFLLMASSFTSWRPMFDRIPLARELAVENTAPPRKAFLAKALAEFEQRSTAGKLTLHMRYEYIQALEMGGKYTTALGEISRISAAFPLTEKRNAVIASEIYERMGDWQNVYESLRNQLSDDNPEQSALLRLCQAELELKMNLAALHTAEETARRFPEAIQAVNARAAVLLALDSAEEALFLLGKPLPRRDRQLDIVEADALFRTQRYKEAVNYCRSIFIPGMTIPPDARQDYMLPAAEAAILWHKVATPTEHDFSANAATLKQVLPTAKNQFMKQLQKLWLDCYEKRCKEGSADISTWLAAGRNDTEKAVSLNQLTLLLCRERKFKEARNAAGSAVKYLPKSQILWRILIGLSDANMDVINAARRSCPADPDIWLAELVAKTEPDKQGAGRRAKSSEDMWTEDTVIKLFTSKDQKDKPSNLPTAPSKFIPTAAARAGEYLFRIGYRKAALLAAHDAVSRARGRLPLYLLGIKLAMAEKDTKWAAECTAEAIRNAIRPSALLYEQMIHTKSIQNQKSISTDNDILEALKVLRREEPDNPLWAQMLGYVRFMRGGWESADALTQMTAALDAGATNKTPYIIAAEAARQLGSHERAVDLLRQGLKNHPGDTEILNNLVYTLAMSPQASTGSVANIDTPQQAALQLVPELLKHSGSDINIQDTVAVAYLRAGEYRSAENMIASILKQAKKGSPQWFRAKLHSATIAWKLNRRVEAEEMLRAILKSSHGIPDDDILTANKLLMEISPMNPKFTPPATHRSPNPGVR